jgi:hypothetical protein
VAFRDLKVDENGLKNAISVIRGSQQVTDQSMLNHLHIFPLSILGSFAGVPVIYVTIHDLTYCSTSRNLFEVPL